MAMRSLAGRPSAICDGWRRPQPARWLPRHPTKAIPPSQQEGLRPQRGPNGVSWDPAPPPLRDGQLRATQNPMRAPALRQGGRLPLGTADPGQPPVLLWFPAQWGGR
jgi:hypothetical protein